MAALISVFLAISLSLLITRIATEALTLTGLSRTSARFQARSAFTGTGFATAESEAVVKHPLRRRIIMWLMFLGNAGFITVISSLVLTFVSTSSTEDSLSRLLYLFLGMGVLWLLATNRAFNRILTRLVRRALRRWTDLDLRDYARLLHLKGEYQVTEIEVNEDNWLAHKKLKQLRLTDEGIAVLGIERRDRFYIGAPHGNTYIYPGDIIITYGRRAALVELDVRPEGIEGEQAHRRAIAIQQQIEREQEKRDRATL
ncbi:TrkA C-terminal domain-containing protein [Pleurocapsales cyanobacterium LEGE 10410]|nr:TrkA C-terminal domain-containing protein [Pleurocapsales cyanobacterium LEGE 10410]